MNRSFEMTTEKTISAFDKTDNSYSPNNYQPHTPKSKKPLIITIIISVALVLMVGIVMAVIALSNSNVSESEIQEAISDFVPPADVVSVDTSQNDPSNDEISFTYDSRARIVSCTYAANNKAYKQNYSYNDTSKEIIIKTVYKRHVIKEKIIKYVEIPVETGFTAVDGYYVRATYDMPTDSNNGNESNIDSVANNTDNNYPGTSNNSTNTKTFTLKEYKWCVDLPEEWLEYGSQGEYAGGFKHTIRGQVGFHHKEIHEWAPMYSHDGWVFDIGALPFDEYESFSQEGARIGKIAEDSEYVYFWMEPIDIPIEEDDEDYSRLLFEYNQLKSCKDQIIASFRFIE